MDALRAFSKCFPGCDSQSGSLPLVLLVAGAGLAVMTAKMAGLDRAVKSSSDSRRVAMARQANQSTVAVFKQLLNFEGSNLPAIFPEPYLQNVASPAADFGSGVATTAASNGWILDPAAGGRRVLRIFLPDPGRMDIGSVYSGSSAPASAQSSSVVLKNVGVTNSGQSWSTTDFVDIAVETPDPVRPGKTIRSEYRLSVPLPPKPTCRLEVDATKARLLVDGVVTSATIQGSGAASPLVTYNRGSVRSGGATSDSVFGRDIELISGIYTGSGTESVPTSFNGNVTGPGGSASCVGTAPFDTAEIKLGINFEDIPDGGDMDFNDAVLCFEGKFRFNDESVISAADQLVSFDSYSTSGCQHTMNVTVVDVDGKEIQGSPWIFSSRHKEKVATIQLSVGDQLFVEMKVQGKCRAYSRKLGEKFHGGRNNNKSVVQIRKDVCNKDGR